MQQNQGVVGFVSPTLIDPRMAASINWSQVLKRCRPEVHKKIIETRGRHEELRRMIADSKTAMPTIDFSRYRELLPPSAHQFVSELEASMSKFKVTKVETAPMLQALEAERSEKVITIYYG